MHGARGVTFGSRAWFDDADRPGRRLAVHFRAERAQVTLSLWDGPLCAGTFHLSLPSAARLIADLAEALSAASIARSPSGSAAADPAPAPVTWARSLRLAAGATAAAADAAAAAARAWAARRGAARSRTRRPPALRVVRPPDDGEPPR